MKRIAVTIPLLLVGADASAITRHDIGGMNCAKVQAIVQSEGATILRYRSKRNPTLQLYDRFVRDGRYCGTSETASRTGVPTADRDYCPVFKCIEADLFDLR